MFAARLDGVLKAQRNLARKVSFIHFEYVFVLHMILLFHIFLYFYIPAGKKGKKTANTIVVNLNFGYFHIYTIQNDEIIL